MTRLAPFLFAFFVAVSVPPTTAAAEGTPPLGEVLREIEGSLAAGANSPRRLENAMARLSVAAPPPGRSTPADLIARLAVQLVPLVAAGRSVDEERRRKQLHRAQATVRLLMQKLEDDEAPAARLPAATVAPGNDDCANAIPLSSGTTTGSTDGGTSDGAASCDASASSADVWFSYTAPSAGLVAWNTFGSPLDTVLSLHSACPEDGGDDELACSDDAWGTLESLVARDLSAGETVLLRVAGASGASGSFQITTDTSAGGIAGRVTKEGSGEPRPDATVSLYWSDGFFEQQVGTAADGSYLFGGVPAADWYLVANAPGLFTEIWDDHVWLGFPQVNLVGDPIAVGNGLRTGIDFALAPGGSIEGRVTEAGVDAPAVSQVVVHDEEGFFVRVVNADPEGHYRFTGLLAGTYFVRTSSFDFSDEIFDDLPCEPDCVVTEGAAISVAPGATTEGVDFELVRLGSISGTVTRAASGSPATSGVVEVYDAAGFHRSGASIEPDGRYRVERLATGHYHARTRSVLMDELYDDLPCEPHCDERLGAAIPVTTGSDTPGIDFALDDPGRIEGRIIAEDTGAGLSAQAILHHESGATVGSSITETGDFHFEHVTPGDYYVSVQPRSPHLDYESELYDDLGCVPGCEITAGERVTVHLAKTTAGIDFVLAHCPFNSHKEVRTLSLGSELTVRACRSIDARNLTVGSTGVLVLRAGRTVVVGDGFKIESGGRLEVLVGPAAVAP